MNVCSIYKNLHVLIIILKSKVSNTIKIVEQKNMYILQKEVYPCVSSVCVSISYISTTTRSFYNNFCVNEDSKVKVVDLHNKIRFSASNMKFIKIFFYPLEKSTSSSLV